MLLAVLPLGPSAASAAESGLSGDPGTAALRECFKRALLKVDAGAVPSPGPDSASIDLDGGSIAPIDAVENGPKLALEPGRRLESGVSLRRGDALLAVGDLASARLFYEHAADQGDPVAATSVAKTLDPLFLQQFGFRMARGDASSALDWHRKAVAAGDREAEWRLARLLDRFPDLMPR